MATTDCLVVSPLKDHASKPAEACPVESLAVQFLQLWAALLVAGYGTELSFGEHDGPLEHHDGMALRSLADEPSPGDRKN